MGGIWGWGGLKGAFLGEAACGRVEERRLTEGCEAPRSLLAHGASRASSLLFFFDFMKALCGKQKCRYWGRLQLGRKCEKTESEE